MRYCMYYVLYLHETCMDQGWNKYPEMHPIIAGGFAVACIFHGVHCALDVDLNIFND